MILSPLSTEEQRLEKLKQAGPHDRLTWGQSQACCTPGPQLLPRASDMAWLPPTPAHRWSVCLSSRPTFPPL